MKAVLIATGYRPGLLPLLNYRPSPMFHILDKPVIIHIIEFLTQQGIKQFEIVLHHFPEMIEQALEEGRRWGINITFHLAKDYEYPFQIISAISSQWDNEPILLGKGDILPYLDISHFKDTSPSNTLFYYPSKVWTGWGVFPVEFIRSIPKDIPEDQLYGKIKEKNFRVDNAPHFLDTTTFMDLQKSNQRLLSHKNPHTIFPTSAHMVEKNVWVSHATSIHPSAVIKAPVFIGEHCLIKAGAHIGPFAVVENNCVVDQNTVVKESLICQHSYVGEGLEINNCIVDRNMLVNLSLNISITISDDFILRELKLPSFREYLLKSLGQYCAIILLVLLSPFILFLMLFFKIDKYDVLSIPTYFDKHHWKTFSWLTFSRKNNKLLPSFLKYLTKLPLLLNMAKGYVHFVGLPPRTIEEVEKLPEDWKKIYLNSKVGFITLASLEYGPKPSQDERYAAESFYTVNMCLSYDLKLCWRWFKQRILGMKI